jgi:hypothetical protein
MNDSPSRCEDTTLHPILGRLGGVGLPENGTEQLSMVGTAT